MRIRLVVCRQGVPDVKLVWPCSRAMTTAKLLEAIDEVIPLEGGTWGLEDYAVELVDDEGGRFECLHFQQLEGVLKDDDQVMYVSLRFEMGGNANGQCAIASQRRCPTQEVEWPHADF